MNALIDAHAHLNSDRLDAPPDALLAEALEVGVVGVVMAGVDPACWASQAALARAFPGRVHPVFGLHPQVIPDLDDAAIAAALSALERLVAEGAPVALGETGLDRLTPATEACLARQEAAFEAQLVLARRHDLPVVLHLLRADALALSVLRRVGLPPRGGMVHAFSGAAPFARALVELGLHVSFAGTLANPQSRRLREAACAVPPERLLIETDSPDQTPWPARSHAPRAPGGWRPNRPANLPHVLRALAEARGEPPEQLAAVTAANARCLFGLEPFPEAPA